MSMTIAIGLMLIAGLAVTAVMARGLALRKALEQGY